MAQAFKNLFGGDEAAANPVASGDSGEFFHLQLFTDSIDLVNGFLLPSQPQLLSHSSSPNPRHAIWTQAFPLFSFSTTLHSTDLLILYICLADFGDFASAADPSPASIPLAPSGPDAAATARPYTKWYNVHERHSLSEFKAEGMILGCIAIIMVVHLLGARRNRSKARKWAAAHAGPLASEFALVGFGGVPPVLADQSGDELVESLGDANARKGGDILREKSLFEFASYATGRLNVAFLDVKLTLKKRFNPLQILAEAVLGFFFESYAGPEDALEAVLYPFDGMEAATVPGLPGAAELRAKDSKSTFDGFVWGLVNKERMKQLREDRYDLSITSTKDNAKLPGWLTVMTESAEITDTVLTPELVKAAEAAGELLDYLIITDQPVDKPKTYVLMKSSMPPQFLSAPFLVFGFFLFFSFFPRPKSLPINIRKQHRRGQTPEARLPPVPPAVQRRLRAPPAHLPVLPARLRPAGAVGALPGGGDAQASTGAGGEHQANPEGRRGREGGGAGAGAREGQEGQAGPGAQRPGRQGAEEVPGEGEGEGEAQDD